MTSTKPTYLLTLVCGHVRQGFTRKANSPYHCDICKTGQIIKDSRKIYKHYNESPPTSIIKE